MLSKLLAGTEWQEFSAYLSPAFVESLAPKAMAQQVGVITRGYVTRLGFKDVKRAVTDMLASRRMATRLGGSPPDTEVPALTTPQSRGQALLELYFAQLRWLDVALLDLRAGRFEVEHGHFVWSPKPLFVRWSPAFIANVRGLYDGFYRDDASTFRAALGALGLLQAEPQLRAHFGTNQGSLEFRLADLRRSMNGIFAAAAKSKAKVAPEMLSLGIFLACLYEHLETLGCAFDVRAAYLAASDGKATLP